MLSDEIPLIYTDEELMSTVPCAKCLRDQVFANLSSCIICDNLIDGCADCYGAHVESHTREEIADARRGLWEDETLEAQQDGMCYLLQHRN